VEAANFVPVDPIKIPERKKEEEETPLFSE